MEGENQTCLRRDEKGEERTLERETTEHTHSRGTNTKHRSVYASILNNAVTYIFCKVGTKGFPAG